MARLTVQELISAIEAVEIAVYEQVSVPGLKNGRWVRKAVRGVFEPDKDRIRIGRRLHREWSGADDAIVTVIHEAIHRVRRDWPERKVRQYEMAFFKSRALREKAAIRLLNVVLFGNDWSEPNA